MIGPDIIRELAHVRAHFQLRAIATVIGAPMPAARPLHDAREEGGEGRGFVHIGGNTL